MMECWALLIEGGALSIECGALLIEDKVLWVV